MDRCPGWSLFANVDGRTRVGITARSATRRSGRRARRRLPRSPLRLRQLRPRVLRRHQGLRRARAPRRRMETWGPVAPMSPRNDEDPVAIPDLWGLERRVRAGRDDRSRLAAVPRDPPGHAAQRTRTTSACARRASSRWPSLLPLHVATAAALARGTFAQLVRGAGLFSSQGCNNCHAGAAYEGRRSRTSASVPIPTRERPSARDRQLPARAVLDVGERRPTSIKAAVRDLDELLSPNRLAADFEASSARAPSPATPSAPPRPLRIAPPDLVPSRPLISHACRRGQESTPITVGDRSAFPGRT